MRGGFEHVQDLVGDGQHFGGVQPTLPFEAGVESLTLEQLHHQEGRAVVGHVVVDDLGCPRMIDRVGDVAFAQEASGHLGVDGQLGVEDLDSNP